MINNNAVNNTNKQNTALLALVHLLARQAAKEVLVAAQGEQQVLEQGT